MRRLESEQPFAERTRENVYALVLEQIVQPKVVGSWSLTASLFERQAIEKESVVPHGAS